MPSKPALLCVDDRQENLAIRKQMLELFGCEVTTANDSSSALKILAADEIDLVMIDYHLGERTNGEDLARSIRATWPKLPLIMLTGDPNIPPSVREAVDAVVIKGIGGPRDMLETIQELLPDAVLKSRRPPGSVSKAS